MSRLPNPWSQVLRVVRRVIEKASGDGLMSLTAFHKDPGNFYLVLVPVGLMPRLDDNGALTDEGYWERHVWREVINGEHSAVIAAYGPDDGSWTIPAWASDTGRARVVVRSRDEPTEVCARRWLGYVDREWLRGFERHRDIDAPMILAWIDRLIAVVDADATANVIFTPGCPLGAMLAEVSGDATPWDEIWWPGWEHLTMRW